MPDLAKVRAEYAALWEELKRAKTPAERRPILKKLAELLGQMDAIVALRNSG